MSWFSCPTNQSDADILLHNWNSQYGIAEGVLECLTYCCTYNDSGELIMITNRNFGIARKRIPSIKNIVWCHCPSISFAWWNSFIFLGLNIFTVVEMFNKLFSDLYITFLGVKSLGTRNKATMIWCIFVLLLEMHTFCSVLKGQYDVR